MPKEQATTQDHAELLLARKQITELENRLEQARGEMLEEFREQALAEE